MHRSPDDTIAMAKESEEEEEEEEAVLSAKRRKTQETENRDAEIDQIQPETNPTTAMVICPTPLQVLAPPGMEDCFPVEILERPRPKEASGTPEFLPFLRILLAQSMKPRRAKVSAIRDYPEGCFRRSAINLDQKTNPDTPKTEQKVNPKSYSSQDRIKPGESVAEAPSKPKLVSLNERGIPSPRSVACGNLSPRSAACGNLSPRSVACGNYSPRSSFGAFVSPRTPANLDMAAFHHHGSISSQQSGHGSISSPQSGHRYGSLASPNYGGHSGSNKALTVYKSSSALTSPVLRNKQKNNPRQALSLKTQPVLANLTPFEARKKVKEVSRLYDAIRRSLVHRDSPHTHNRPDLYAGTLLNNSGRSLGRCSNKCIGAFPGVEVGDVFYFRMELSVIGMHGPTQGGIDFLRPQDTGYEIPIAVSIISSGGYEADDKGDVLVYTGQGGKGGADGKQSEDQKLERGNLAMEGSFKLQIPVRVIRGVKDDSSPSHKTYTYDGLYNIHEFWSEKGKSGFEEFKFKLVRLPNQPELGSAKLKLAHMLKYKSCNREGVLLDDISKGKEAFPVCVINAVDNEMPPEFNYTTTNMNQAEGLQLAVQGEICDCVTVCISHTCACIKRNCLVLPYLSNGILLRERGLIYECGDGCRCSQSCANRSTQMSVRSHLEVYRKENGRWGLRTQDVIPSGGFVCEYVGSIVNGDPLQTEYFLDTGSIPSNNPCWGDVSDIMSERKAIEAAINAIQRPCIKIDSSEFGNLSRFINHSNTPNLLAQCVMRNEHGYMYPHVMMFAMENIPPFQELTLDYGDCHSRTDP